MPRDSQRLTFFFFAVACSGGPALLLAAQQIGKNIFGAHYLTCNWKFHLCQVVHACINPQPRRDKPEQPTCPIPQLLGVLDALWGSMVDDEWRRVGVDLAIVPASIINKPCSIFCRLVLLIGFLGTWDFECAQMRLQVNKGDWSKLPG